MTHTIAVCTVEETPDDGHRNCPKHVEFYSKNKIWEISASGWFYYKNLSRCTVTWKSDSCYLYSVYFVSHRPHVSGMFVAHHQDVYCIYTTIGTCCAFLVGMSVGRVGLEFHSKPANVQSAKNHNTYQLLYIYSITPDDELQICPKHVEGDWRNKLRINSASGWFLLHTNSVTIEYSRWWI